MQRIANITVGIVACVQVVIAMAEMFLWKGAHLYLRIPKLELLPSEADKIAPIVANAGLYNLFIAAGLVWSLCVTSNAQSLKVFFLSCVAVAGIYGAMTLKPTTLALQTLPALLALILVWMANKAI
jgi:putative membrane protein